MEKKQKAKTKLIITIILFLISILCIFYLFIRFNIYVLKISDIQGTTMSARDENNDLYMFKEPKLIIPKDIKEGDVILVINTQPKVTTLQGIVNKEGEQVIEMKNVELLIRVINVKK